ncbi:uncharacterized protein PAC_04744 [Phialocephala subalpina]|uniref:Uncharacterized protein n=1 Tax=Phialocephala subalpina TaxID=576137 RepID=A0A1L7WQ12_9HELO|nr:uncharacterized protein PAC_04744 [Phialocephala subalpina]
MAGPLNRLAASMVTVRNENSASLVNLSVDFTLLKVEAPVEFSALGSTISRKRKADAEEGPLHRTARRLGALFEDLLPPAEDLFRAYGRRVSEISSMPSINPRDGSKKDGIFASHVGADTATIWAAATSGSAAISAHLLGCMLARIFTGPEAVSIWVELVQRRKEWIHDQHENKLYSHESRAANLAAQQDISRAELASWDASARAWLQSADQAKEFQHKQTMLILNNASVPISNECEIYASVTKAWAAALEAMNSLVNGIPQRVQDGVALLAISSWHLYPDMIIFAPSRVDVKMKDPIFESSALLTLGLEHLRSDVKSVYWSLPLACLQYYGRPVQACRNMNQENSRITCQQFSYILLGCVFDGWKEYASTNEEGFRWVELLGKLLKIYEGHPRNRPKVAWFTNLYNATKLVTHLDELERKSAYQLINLGRRRPSFLYGSNAAPPPPIFGLSQLSILIPALKNDESRIRLLRQLRVQLKLNGSQYLIRYQPSGQRWIEYASIEATQRSRPKRTHDGKIKESLHPPITLVQWITLSPAQLPTCIQRGEDYDNLPRLMCELKELEEATESDQNATNFWKNGLNSEESRRTHDISQLKLKGLVFGTTDDFMTAGNEILHQISGVDGVPAATSQLYFTGDIELAALFAVTPNPFNLALKGPPSAPLLSPDFLEPFMVAQNFDSETLDAHLYPSSNQVQSLKALKLKRRDASSTLTLSEAFACIAMFESATCNLDPTALSEAFAMSSGNSLYVAGSLLCDPQERTGSSEIRRVVGNIGRAGITFLVSPPEVNEREPNAERWMAINHNKFDGKLEDHFQQTSVHLSFTQYQIPLATEDTPRHTIDNSAVLVEALVSVYGGGTWVAEIDILKAFKSKFRKAKCSAVERHLVKDSYESLLEEYPHLAATSIENWDELIEAPSTGTIAVRAHGNWLARLATMAVCVNNNFTPFVLTDEVCWNCCAKLMLQQDEKRIALIC